MNTRAVLASLTAGTVLLSLSGVALAQSGTGTAGAAWTAGAAGTTGGGTTGR